MPQVLGLKRSGVGHWLVMVIFSVRNSFISWMFFLVGFILGLIEMFTSATLFFLMGQFVAAGAEAHLTQYSLTYGAYILTGVMFNLVMDRTLRDYHNACAIGCGSNQLFMTYPGGFSAFLTGTVVSSYLRVALHTTIYLLVGRWLFNISIVVNNLPAVSIVLILAVVALTGLGLMAASTFSLLNARQWGKEPVSWLVGFGVTLLSGVYFPPTVLPVWLQQAGAWLPQTHALHAARLCLSGQAGLGDAVVVGEIFLLLKFTAVTLPVGLLLFAAGVRKMKQEGKTTRWS